MRVYARFDIDGLKRTRPVAGFRRNDTERRKAVTKRIARGGHPHKIPIVELIIKQ